MASNRRTQSWMLALTVAVAVAVAVAPASAHAESAPVVAALGAPRLQIDSSFPVTLHQIEPLFGLDEIVCQAPCSRVVDGRAGQRFYFAGDEIPASPSFALVEKSGDVVATVHKGSFGMLTTGHALMAPAILHLVGGAVLLPFMTLTHDEGTAADLQYAAAATLATGAAMLVTSSSSSSRARPASASTGSDSLLGGGKVAVAAAAPTRATRLRSSGTGTVFRS